MVANRKRLYLVTAFLLLVGLLLARRYATASDPLQAAWNTAQASGGYTFSSDVRQSTVPIASVLNVGQRAKQDAFHLAGTTDLANDSVHLTLWSQGGNLLDQTSGIEIRAANGIAEMRQEGQEWQQLPNFLDGVAPGGDFLSFLDSAELLTSTAHDDGTTVHTFTLDGAKFAAQMTAIVNAQMRSRGELTPGMSVQVGEQLRGVTGDGELWVNADGYPIRQLINLQYPPSDDQYIASEIITTYQFETMKDELGSMNRFPSSFILHPSSFATFFSSLALLTLTAFAALYLIRHANSRVVYNVVVLLIVTSSVFAPLLQVIPAHAASTRREANQQVNEQFQAQQEEQTEIRTDYDTQLQDELTRISPAALAQIRNDDNTDSDGDGLTDVQEQFLQSNPFSAEYLDAAREATANNRQSTVDSDEDGLTDYEEGLLGTTPTNPDSDYDGLTDSEEVVGFTHAGRQWHSNPLSPDSNNDGLPDAREWNSPSTQATWDTDGDNIPDLHDRDNDGDGVPDKFDISPFTNDTRAYNSADPFSYALEGLTAGEPTFVQLQLRPSNPDHLWYSTTPLNWPLDHDGNIVDEDGATFSNTSGDMRLVPMVELTIDDSPTNLPLTTPFASTTMATVPGAQTISFIVNQPPPPLDPITGTISFENSGSDLAVSFDLTRLDDLDLRRGTCAAPDEFVETIPTPTVGNTTVVPNTQLQDWADGDHVLVAWQHTRTNIIACAAVPSLVFDGAMMVDQAALEPYQISVTASADSTIRAYLPLSLVTDPDTGQQVAFNANMLYLPTGVWNNVHTARMVWAVQMLQDNVCDYRGLFPSRQGCQQERDNVPQILHLYDESWQLTGFSLREDRGISAALLYEDPAEDPLPNYEQTLAPLMLSLDEHYLGGRDCDTLDADDNCIGDGVRDIVPQTLQDRFNHPTNLGISDEQRWGALDILRVDRFEYDTLDLFVRDSAETDIAPILDAHEPFWSSADPITPTIAFAYDQRMRAVNLDGVGDSSVTLNNGTLRVQMNGFPEMVTANIKLASYRYDDSADAWSQLSQEAVLDLIAQRHTVDFADADSPEQAESLLLLLQFFFLGWYRGINSVVQVGDAVQTTINRPDGFGFNNTAPGQTLIGGVGGGIFRAIFGVSAFVITNGFTALLTLGLIVLIIAVVVILILALVILGLLFLSPLSSSEVQIIAFNLILPALIFIISLVLAILGIVRLILDIIAGVLTASSIVLVFLAPLFALIGLIIELGVIWGFFVYQIATGNVDVNSGEFASLLGFSLAASLVAAIFALIVAIPLIGLIIVGLIGAFDAIVFGLCELGVAGALQNVNGECFSIRGSLTRAIAEEFISGDIIFDFDANPRSISLDNFGITLNDPAAGMVAGNALVVSGDVRTRLFPSEPGGPAVSAYRPSTIRRTGVLYELSTAANGANSSVYDGDPNGWNVSNRVGTFTFTIIGALDPRDNGRTTVDLYRASYRPISLVSDPIPLGAGINQAKSINLNSDFMLPTYQCALERCSSPFATPITLTTALDLGVYDVLPVTAEQFVSGSWDAGFNAAQRDRDGDGLLAVIHGGNDPDDTTWDADGDGLSDAFERQYQALGFQNGGGQINPLSADSDSDGVCDFNEIFYGSHPSLIDSDGDGLTDGQEIYRQDVCDLDNDSNRSEFIGGYTFTYDTGETVQISSNPNERDGDGDGMSDLLERQLHLFDPVAFPYHPLVYNVIPIGLYPATSDADNVVLPNASVVYSLTVQNNLDVPLYADGDIDVAFPTALGGTAANLAFSLFQAESATLTRTVTAANNGSQQVSILNDGAATLADSAELVAPPNTTFTLQESLPFIIDDDLPTSTLGGSGYVQAGGFRTIGGFAADPTSYIQAVEISTDGGATFETTTGAEAWAYVWNVPTTEGRIMLQTRAIDAVDHVENPINAMDVIVDGTPPTLATAISDNPIVRSQRNLLERFTLPVSGTVVDPAIGADAGSGVQYVEVLVEPLSNSWQMAEIDGDSWSLDYILAAQDDNQEPVTEPTGQYTVSVRTRDNVENATVEANYLTIPIRIDNTAPIVTTDPINQVASQLGDDITITRTRIISQPIPLTGTITDVGSVASGVDSAEIAFVPGELLDTFNDPLLLMYFNEPQGAFRFDVTGSSQFPSCAVGTIDRCPRGTGDGGAFGGAASFDGDDALEFGKDIPENGYTLALYFNTTCDDCGLFSADRGTLSTTQHDRDLYFENGNVCAYVSGANQNTICSSGTDFADGNWHQVVHVLGNGNNALYVDGELQATEPFVTFSTFDQNGLNLGFAPEATNDFYTGQVDEFAIYGETLSADQVATLFRRWQPVTLDASRTTHHASRDWTHTVPLNIEGFFQIDIRAADVLGNRNDSQRSEWAQWSGLIDTAPPTVNLQVLYTGSSGVGGAGATAQTTYIISAADYNLSTDGLQMPCALEASDLRYDDSDFWQAISGGAQRLNGIEARCTVNGHQSTGIVVRACDLFGRCAAAQPDQFRLFGAGPQRNGAGYIIGSWNPLVLEPATTHLIVPHNVLDLRFDELNQQIYWIESTITLDDARANVPVLFRRANADGSNVETIISTTVDAVQSSPSFALNPEGGRLYWSNSEAIYTANLDGSGISELFAFSEESLLFNQELAIDRANGRLYWSVQHGIFSVNGQILEHPNTGIWAMDLDGSNPELVLPVVDGGQTFSERNHISTIAFDAPRNWLYYGTRTGLYRTRPDGSGYAFLNGERRFIPSQSAFDIETTSNQLYMRPDGQFIVYDLTTNRYNRFGQLLGTAESLGFARHITLGRVTGRTITEVDLALSSRTDSDIVGSGTNVRYDFTIDNRSPLTATGVTLTDTLPDGATFVSGVGCAADGATVTCALPNIAPNGSQTANITVNAGAGSQLVNSASVAAQQADSNPANNSATAATVQILAAPTATPESPATGRYIFWPDYSIMRRVRLDQADGDDIAYFVPNDDRQIDGIAVDDLNQRIYMGRTFIEEIQRSDFYGNELTTIISDVYPLEIVVDSGNGKLYWLEIDPDTRLYAIGQSDLDGNNRTTVVSDINYGEGLAVDPLRGHLYWSADVFTLYRSNLDGSDVQVWIDGTAEARSVAIFSFLTVDAYGGWLYWIDSYNYEVRRGSLTTRRVETLYALDSNQSRRGLVVDSADNALYFAVGTTLYRGSLDGSQAEQIVATNLSNIAHAGYQGATLALVYTAADAPPPPTATPTSTPTTGPSPTPTNTPIPPTPTTTPMPLPTPTPGGISAENIYYGNFGSIHAAPIDGCADSSCTITVTDGLAERPNGLTVVSDDDHLYWLLQDVAVPQLMRLDRDGSNQTTVADGEGGFVIDEVNDFVYYATFNGEIHRYDLNGNGDVTLVTGLGFVNHIALDPDGNRLFWIDESNFPEKALYQADLDTGANVTLLLSEDGTNNPPIIAVSIGGLAFDGDHNWLFWSEYGGLNYPFGRISRLDLGCGTPPHAASCVLTVAEEAEMNVRGLALDLTTLRAYWGSSVGNFVDGYTETIRSTLIDGTGPIETVVGDLPEQASDVDLYFPPFNNGSCVVSADFYEPDDNAFTDFGLSFNAPTSADHNFHTSTDEDWHFLDLLQNVSYQIEVVARGADVAPFLEIYDVDGATLLTSGADVVNFTANANDRYYLRVTNTLDRATCETVYDVLLREADDAEVGAGDPTAGGVAPVILQSAIITPADGGNLDSLAQTTITASAIAKAGIDEITITLNGAPLDVTSFGTTTETLHSVNWTPPSEGVYRLDLSVSDDAGNVQTQTNPITLTVDTTVPAVNFAQSVLTTTHLISPTVIGVAGSASDSYAVASVSVNVDGAGFQAATLDGTNWLFALNGARDGETVPATARVTDVAGRTATATANLTIDVVEPEPSDITITHNGTVITPTQTIAEANPEVVMTWAAFSDGSGVTGYYAGWTLSETPSLSELTAYANAGTHTQMLGESEIRYAHLVAIDAVGNLSWQTFGPFYIDSAETPSPISESESSRAVGQVGNFDYTGWLRADSSLLSADREILRGNMSATTIGTPQKFYTTWNVNGLRMAWVGADWATHGDLFIYLDTGAAGSADLYNPYGGGTTIGLPSGMSASHMVVVESDTDATLYQWDGAAWQVAQLLDGRYFSHDSGTLPLITDIYLAFDQLSITANSALGVLAVASEEDTLRLWASAPDRQPLNSDWVINPNAANRNLSGYDLTNFFQWPNLQSGIVPNAGRYEDADLRVSISSQPTNIKVGYLTSDLFDILTPNQPLDPDGDGVPNVTLPLNEDPDHLRNGQTVTFTIAYENRGNATATGVSAELTTVNGLTLNSGSVVNIGDVAAGASGEVVVTAVASVARSAASAEIIAAISDTPHGTYDWYWFQNKIDTAAPTNVTVATPLTYMRPFTRTITGSASDPSGIASVELELQPLPAGTLQTVICPDPSPDDGQFSCTINVGALTGFDSFTIRARATDIHGNQSAYSPLRTLIVDTAAPTLTLDPAFEAAIADGFLSRSDPAPSGTLSDDHDATQVTICRTTTQTDCNTVTVASDGSWQGSAGSGDGVEKVITFVGRDAVGNQSTPIQRTFTVDTIAPVVVTTQQLTQVDLSDYQARQAGDPVLIGTVSDGDSVANVYVRLVEPDGTVVYQTATLNGGAWSYTPVLRDSGDHRMTVEVYDAAGNVRVDGHYLLDVDGTATAVSLRHVTSGVAVGWLYGVVGLLAVSLVMWRKRRA